MPKNSCLYYALLVGFALRVFAATTHMVVVGVEGSFYDPSTTSAQVGDTVTFIFGGDVHTVTQSSFDNPCEPLPGGFSSGFQGRGADFSGPVVSWNLIIMNASAPIWFFCEVTTPSSHCAAGMVGAINPPSIDMFNNFTAAAKLVSAIPATVIPTPVLTGVGAFASSTAATTSVPMSVLISTPLPSSSSTSSSSSFSSTAGSASSAAATSSATGVAVTSTSHTNIGAIVGGIIGGVTIFLILVIFLLWRRKSRPNSSFFDYGVPVRQLDPTVAFQAAKSQEDRERMQELPYDGSQLTSRSASALASRKPSVASGLVLQPQRLAQSGHEQAIAKQTSFTSTADTTSPLSNALGTGTITDRDAVLQALAQEVVNVLHQGGGSVIGNGETLPNRQPEPMPKLAPNRARSQIGGGDIDRGDTPAPPPNYRTALGGQSPSW